MNGKGWSYGKEFMDNEINYPSEKAKCWWSANSVQSCTKIVVIIKKWITQIPIGNYAQI